MIRKTKRMKAYFEMLGEEISEAMNDYQFVKVASRHNFLFSISENRVLYIHRFVKNRKEGMKLKKYSMKRFMELETGMNIGVISISDVVILRVQEKIKERMMIDEL